LPQNQGASQVILWADTFNNYFHPQTAQAAVEVLEGAGFEVLVPQANLCCGRPLYDFGMLDRAKRLLIDTLDVLEPKLAAGILSSARTQLRRRLPRRTLQPLPDEPEPAASLRKLSY